MLIVAVLVAAGAHGLWLGAAAQLLSFGGFAAGLAAGAAIAPYATRLTSDPLAQVVVSLMALFGTATLVGGLGRTVAVRAMGWIRKARLAGVDAGVGAVVAVVFASLSVWLVAGMLATVPAPGVAGAIQSSAILRSADRVLPPSPSLFSRIQALLESTGLPPVFAGLEPRPAPGLPGAGAAEARAALARAGPSTVKLTGVGCGRVQSGSGFLAASGLVVTNAHVIAGIDRPVVESRAGRSAATPVLFDPALDVAVLRVDWLSGRPLPVLGGEVGRGTRGAAVGYPGGGSLRAEPAVVLAQYDALGRDIYSRSLTRRPVYELQSRVRAGNSGGPVVDGNGSVVGVVFSRSAAHSDIGFAIPGPAVLERVRRAQATSTRASTGPCMR